MLYTEMSRTLIWHRPRLQRIAASKAKASLAGANRHRSSGTVAIELNGAAWLTWMSSSRLSCRLLPSVVFRYSWYAMTGPTTVSQLLLLFGPKLSRLTALASSFHCRREARCSETTASACFREDFDFCFIISVFRVRFETNSFFVPPWLCFVSVVEDRILISSHSDLISSVSNCSGLTVLVSVELFVLLTWKRRFSRLYVVNDVFNSVTLLGLTDFQKNVRIVYFKIDVLSFTNIRISSVFLKI